MKKNMKPGIRRYNSKNMLPQPGLIHIIKYNYFFYGILFIAGLIIGTGGYVMKNQNSTSLTVLPLKKADFIKPAPTNTPTPSPIPGYCLKVPVIFYHHIEPMKDAVKAGHGQLTVDATIFENQMKYLVERGYSTISAENLIQALRTKSVLPGKPIVVTIDDGYLDNYMYAYPVARKYNIILNLMIPTGLIGNKGYLSWSNLKEMADSGLVYAYDHTWSHFSMPSGDEAKEQLEIMTAKTQLEEHLGRPVSVFAYPYGSENNRTIRLLEKDGFVGAFTTKPSFTQCDSIIYSLHRNRMGGAHLSAYGL